MLILRKETIGIRSTFSQNEISLALMVQYTNDTPHFCTDNKIKYHLINTEMMYIAHNGNWNTHYTNADI